MCLQYKHANPKDWCVSSWAMHKNVLMIECHPTKQVKGFTVLFTVYAIAPFFLCCPFEHKCMLKEK